MGAGPFCEACGRQASPDARFCAGCGRPLDSARGRPLEAAKPVAPSPAAPPSAAAPSPAEERELYAIRPLAIQTLLELVLAILTLGLVWVFLALSRRLQVRYRITNQRVEVRTGFLTVTRRSIELFRVQDFEVREPFFLRLRGAGDLVIRSLDVDEPTEILRAIPRIHEVHEALRAHTLEERRRTQVRLVEGL